MTKKLLIASLRNGDEILNIAILADDFESGLDILRKKYPRSKWVLETITIQEKYCDDILK